jgi:hypothetical protein
MSCRGKTNNHYLRQRVTKSWNTPTPVVVVNECCALFDRNLFPPLHEALTLPAVSYRLGK